MIRRLAFVAATLLLGLGAAQWPAKPVRLVVPLSAGGFADVPARIPAPCLSAQRGR